MQSVQTTQHNIPSPKFNKGDFVKFTKTHRETTMKNGYDASNSNFVLTSMLHIYEYPIFNHVTKTWVYCYDYGYTGTSEGSAPENILEPY